MFSTTILAADIIQSYPDGQVQTGRSRPELSNPGVQTALAPHGLGEHKSADKKQINSLKCCVPKTNI